MAEWGNADPGRQYARVACMPSPIPEYQRVSLVIAKPDGSPQRRDRMSANFGQLIRHLEMPHIRFHDLRHTAATNMHQLAATSIP